MWEASNCLPLMVELASRGSKDGSRALSPENRGCLLGSTRVGSDLALWLVRLNFFA